MMKIQLIFDISQYLLYVPDGFIIDVKQLQLDFFEWCETQEDAFSIAPGNKFAWCYSQETFLRYINEVVLSESAEKAYFVDHPKCCNKTAPRIIF